MVHFSAGDLLVVVAERSEPALGDVTVDWELTTTNSQRPELRFNRINGTLNFLPVRRYLDIT